MSTPLAILMETGVPLLIVGGTAVQIYGFSRYTKDFDCVVASDREAELAAAMSKAGFVEFVRNALVVRYRHLAHTDWIVDTLLVNTETFAKMWEERREIRLASLSLTVAAPLHIASMKLHAMRQNPGRQMFDLLDVLELLQRDRGNWTLNEVRTACERYGPAGIFDTIRPHLE
jgi:hypothetical protein